MIEITTLEVSGFTGAIKGMRNPFKNRDKSDSGPAMVVLDKMDQDDPFVEACRYWDEEYGLNMIIGPKDLELCQKLLRTNKDDDSKFMRMIHVQADVNAPLYWWKEYDTYKISTVANSESTMHTIHKREFDFRDFAHDALFDDYTIGDDFDDETYVRPDEILSDTIMTLNRLRKLYLQAVEEKKDAEAKDYWYNMIQLLPTSYMQKRTIDLNYQTLKRIWFARKGHKLSEWQGFRDWIMELPYAEELITYRPSGYFGFDSEKFYNNVVRLRAEGKTDEEICDMFAMTTGYFRTVYSHSAKIAKEKAYERRTSNNPDSGQESNG